MLESLWLFFEAKRGPRGNEFRKYWGRGMCMYSFVSALGSLGGCARLFV